MVVGHGGFVIGSEMSGGVENIRVSHCRFMGTDVGLRFKSARGRGGLVRDIWCDHIYMKDIVAEAITFNLYYAGVSATERVPSVTGSSGSDAPFGANKEAAVPEVDETTPEFRDIHFADIVCAGARQAIFVNGLPEQPLRDVDFTRCVFWARKGVEIHHAQNLTYHEVRVNGEAL